MNKLAVLICAILFSAHSFGSVFTKHFSLPSQKIQGEEKHEDFSGTWTGDCGWGEEQFIIEQTATKIRIIDGPEEAGFDYPWLHINSLETNSLNSSESQITTVHDAILSGNKLVFVISEFFKSNAMNNRYVMVGEIIKKGDVLIVNDEDFANRCEFRRVSL